MPIYSTKGWVQLIIILLLFQFIVQAGAYVYADKDSIIGYISFSGTIVSIVLAVIAIIYSFFQSMNQSRNENNISTQVDRLIQTTNTVVSATKKLSDDLKLLDEIKGKIIDTHSAVIKNDENYRDMNYKLSSLFENGIVNKKNNKKENSVIFDNGTLFNKIFDNQSSLIIISLIILKKSSDDKIKVEDIGVKIIDPLSEDMMKENNELLIVIKNLLRGGVFTLFNILLYLEFIEKDKDDLFKVGDEIDLYFNSLKEERKENKISERMILNTINFLFFNNS